MAPLLSGVWWGPEAGIAGSGAAAAGGVASWLDGGQLVLVGTLSALTAVLLLSAVLLLCASCQGQKKATNGHPATDHANLMNGVSERETISQSADSLGTDVAVSSSHNGLLTSGTVLTDTQDLSPQTSEDILSSQSELRSSKCPQDRELPSIPPNNGLVVDGPPPSGDSTYEVVKEIAAASRDVSVEDSLYETVKELKEPPSQLDVPNGFVQLSPDDPPHHHPPAPPNHHPPAPPNHHPPARPHHHPPAPPHHHPSTLLNGHLSPGTPERLPLSAAVEYASVDLNKKSRHSADMDAKRHPGSAGGPSDRPVEEPEEDLPPPVPEKVMDENDNRPVVMNELAGATVHNGEVQSPLSHAPEINNHILSDNEGAVYSTVNKTNCYAAVEDKEHDYSSIAEIKGLVPASSSSDLYATVRDVYNQPDGPHPGEDPNLDSTDPGYEAIRIPKTGSSDDGHRAGWGPEGPEGPDGTKAEPDYASVGELGLSRETSRL